MTTDPTQRAVIREIRMQQADYAELAGEYARLAEQYAKALREISRLQAQLAWQQQPKRKAG